MVGQCYVAHVREIIMQLCRQAIVFTKSISTRQANLTRITKIVRTVFSKDSYFEIWDSCISSRILMPKSIERLACHGWRIFVCIFFFLSYKTTYKECLTQNRSRCQLKMVLCQDNLSLLWEGEVCTGNEICAHEPRCNAESNSLGIPIVIARYPRIFRIEFRLKFMNVAGNRRLENRDTDCTNFA